MSGGLAPNWARIRDGRVGSGQPDRNIDMPSDRIPVECSSSWSVISARTVEGVPAMSRLRYRSNSCLCRVCRPFGAAVW